MENKLSHAPVLKNEIVREMGWSEPGVIIADLTVGGGGHLRALLESSSVSPEKVFAVDQDPEALAIAKQNLSESAAAAKTNLEWVHSNFSEWIHA